jgi:phytoene synthase
MSASHPLSDPLAAAQDPRNIWHPEHATVADYSRRSNLALAFLSLPRAKRADMDVFYTFCRLVDDIADSDTLPPEDKLALLAAWREAVEAPDGNAQASSGLAERLRLLIKNYSLQRSHLQEIITGVEMDVYARLYPTFEQLRTYCFRVASAVGLVSIEIFGYTDPSARQYAIDLGLALQMTNIIRDVAVDLDNGGRIYLPLEDLERFGYSPEDLRARTYDRRFRSLMKFETERAEGFFVSARRHLAPADRRSMVAAEAMRGIYRKLLVDMKRDRFRVFERTYRLNKVRKAWTLLTTVLGARMS